MGTHSIREEGLEILPANIDALETGINSSGLGTLARCRRYSNIFLLLPLKRLHKPKERDIAFLCIDYKFSTEESQEKILSRATSASFQKMQQKTAKSTVAASRYLGGHATIHLPLPLRDYKSNRGAGDLSI